MGEMGKPLTLADVLNHGEESVWADDHLIPIEVPIDVLDQAVRERGCDTYWSRWNNNDALMIRRDRLHFPVFHLGEPGLKVPYLAQEFLPSFKQVFSSPEGAVG